MTSFTRLVDALPDGFPFTAPERLERDHGRPVELRLGANESVFGIAEGAREAMVKAAARIAWYGDPESLELRDEIAGRHGVTPANVSVGAGIDDLLGLAVRVLLEPGAVGVGPDGSYPMFPFHVAGYGGRLETVPYRDDRCDLAGLAAAAHRHDARLVYLATGRGRAHGARRAHGLRQETAGSNPRPLCTGQRRHARAAPALRRRLARPALSGRVLTNVFRAGRRTGMLI